MATPSPPSLVCVVCRGKVGGMSKPRRRTPLRAPSLVVVHNTTPAPQMVDLAGHMVPGGSSTRVDPNDPVATGLIEAGVLIVKENA